MGSVMLPVESEEAQTILELARAVMEDALPAFDGAFHLEAFLTHAGPVFSEVGSRIGGGSINEEVELSYGFNLVEESILAQREVPFRHTSVRQRSLAGQRTCRPFPGCSPKLRRVSSIRTSSFRKSPNRADASPR